MDIMNSVIKDKAIELGLRLMTSKLYRDSYNSKQQ